VREKTLLVVLDPLAQGAQPVLERAAWLAERANARLELFVCDYDADLDAGQVATVWMPNPGARDQLLERHRRTLEELAAPLRARGLTVTLDVVWEHPLDAAVVKKAAAHDYWLVAKDTHHHNVLQRTLLTNVDWHLIRACPAPLLLVKGRPLATEPVVMAAVDPLSEHDKPAALDDRIFNTASELTKVLRGHLHVVHAFATPMGVELPAEVGQAIEREHREAMRRFLDSHVVIGDRAHIYEGLPHECLVQAANDHAVDFMVMGAVARRGLKRLFIGSTAERALDRLPCDLVIIKPLEFELPEDFR
jgi:universal stress protein E